MFLIRSRDGNVFYIFENKTYTVGRKECNILIKDDSSISRTHARLKVEDGSVVVRDLAAKYKTYINDNELEQLGSQKLQIGDVIKFGILHSSYTLEKIKMKVACSGLSNKEKKIFFECVRSLDGTVLPSWSTSCTHLTVRELMLTSKVLCALVEGQPIVTLKYWEDLAKAVEKGSPPPNIDSYRPICAESILKKNLSFQFDPRRKSLFEDKVFVFQKITDKRKLDILIELAGGRCILWEENPLSPKEICSKKPEYILIQDSDSQLGTTDSFSKMVDFIQQTGKRPIPQQEIAIAVLMCSCEKDCNPCFNRAATLLEPKPDLVYSENLLAGATDSQYFTPKEEKPNIIVPQTVEDDIWAVPMKQGLVTSTQVDHDDAGYLTIEESKIKREGEPLEKDDCKRFKIEDEQQCEVGTSRTSARPQENGKSGDISILEGISAIELESPTPSRKRSTDDKERVGAPAKRPSLSSNPFTSDPRRNSMIRANPYAAASTASFGQSKLRDSTKGRHTHITASITDLVNSSADVKPVITLHTATSHTENNSSWLCKRVINEETDATKGNKSNLSVSDAMSNYVNSFRDCIVVKKLPLVVRKESDFTCRNNNNTTVDGQRNFKKFKKVQPLHLQTIIYPASRYKIITCNTDDE